MEEKNELNNNQEDEFTLVKQSLEKIEKKIEEKYKMFEKREEDFEKRVEEHGKMLEEAIKLINENEKRMKENEKRLEEMRKETKEIKNMLSLIDESLSDFLLNNKNNNDEIDIFNGIEEVELNEEFKIMMKLNVQFV